MQDILAGESKISTLSQDQLDLWELTLEALLDTLESSYTRTNQIRLELETISRDIVQLKALVESMVATAQNNVDARMAELQRELDDAQALADANRGCFKDFATGFTTIITAGISCAMLDQTLKKCEKNARDIRGTKDNFSNNVAPLVGRLAGLTGVAEDLLREALTKTTIVRNFEEELITSIDKFRQKQGSSLAIRMQMMREKMVTDLDNLLASCDTTIRNVTIREDAFLSILTEAESRMRENQTMLVNLAATEGQLFLI